MRSCGSCGATPTDHAILPFCGDGGLPRGGSISHSGWSKSRACSRQPGRASWDAHFRACARGHPVRFGTRRMSPEFPATAGITKGESRLRSDANQTPRRRVLFNPVRRSETGRPAFDCGGGERTRRPEQLGLSDRLAMLTTRIRIPRLANRRTRRSAPTMCRRG